MPLQLLTLGEGMAAGRRYRKSCGANSYRQLTQTLISQREGAAIRLLPADSAQRIMHKRFSVLQRY
jgi:hypothetical protein